MTTALAALRTNKNVILTDVMLLAVLYLLPSLSHLTALPLYRFEPMRIALIVALLYTNRANAYLVAFTIPLASAMITGHPVLFKAMLMGVELSILVATYAFFVRLDRIPGFVALIAGIVLGKIVYYTLKSVSLGAGLLAGNLISTPVQTQLILAVGTAVVFGLIEHYRPENNRQ